MSDKSCHEMAECIIEIPVDSRSFILDSGHLNCAYHNHFISVGMFKDKQCTKLVTPIQGGYLIQATDDGIQWGNITNGTIDATSLCYKRPNMSGYAAAIKAIGSDIRVNESEPVFFRLRIHSYM